jgi:hypothetical protein
MLYRGLTCLGFVTFLSRPGKHLRLATASKLLDALTVALPYSIDGWEARFVTGKMVAMPFTLEYVLVVRPFEGHCPPGAGALIIFGVFAAQLKWRPDTKPFQSASNWLNINKFAF